MPYPDYSIEEVEKWRDAEVERLLMNDEMCREKMRKEVEDKDEELRLKAEAEREELRLKAEAKREELRLKAEQAKRAKEEAKKSKEEEKKRKEYERQTQRFFSQKHPSAITAKDWKMLDTVKTLTGHTDYVRSLALLPNGTLASGSDDKTIRIWDEK